MVLACAEFAPFARRQLPDPAKLTTKSELFCRILCVFLGFFRQLVGGAADPNAEKLTKKSELFCRIFREVVHFLLFRGVEVWLVNNLIISFRRLFEAGREPECCSQDRKPGVVAAIGLQIQNAGAVGIFQRDLILRIR